MGQPIPSMVDWPDMGMYFIKLHLALVIHSDLLKHRLEHGKGNVFLVTLQQ
jgi:hypothetical protein